MNYKEIILGVLMVAVSVVAFLLWEIQAIPAIVAGDFHSSSQFIAPVVALAFSAALFGLGAMFIRDPRIVYTAAIISTGIPYMYTAATTTVVLLSGISIFGIAFAIYKIRREFTLSVGFSVSKILKSGLPLYFTAAALTISLFYANTLDRKNSLTALLPKPAFYFTLHHFLNSSFARSITGLSDVRHDITADELLDMLVTEQLKKQGVDEKKIPADQIARLRAIAHTDIARQYGITFRGDEKVQDLFYTAVAERADDILAPYRAYLPLVSALAFFFALKALMLPMYLISLVIAFVLIKLLLSVKMLKRAMEQIEVERITF